MLIGMDSRDSVAYLHNEAFNLDKNIDIKSYLDKGLKVDSIFMYYREHKELTYTVLEKIYTELLDIVLTKEMYLSLAGIYRDPYKTIYENDDYKVYLDTVDIPSNGYYDVMDCYPDDAVQERKIEIIAKNDKARVFLAHLLHLLYKAVRLYRSVSQDELFLYTSGCDVMVPGITLVAKSNDSVLVRNSMDFNSTDYKYHTMEPKLFKDYTELEKRTKLLLSDFIPYNTAIMVGFAYRVYLEDKITYLQEDELLDNYHKCCNLNIKIGRGITNV